MVLPGGFSLKPTNQQNWNSWNVAWNIAFSEAKPLSLNLKDNAASACVGYEEI